MSKIEIEIDDCMDCPYCRTKRLYTSDSWESAYNYYYYKKTKDKPVEPNKIPNKMIAGCMETFDKMPSIPDWCPIEVKD